MTFGIDREAAVDSWRRRLRQETRLARVSIARCQGARSAGRHVLLHRRRYRAVDHCRIVRALYRHHECFRRAIDTRYRERVRDVLACFERLHIGRAVVERVAPLAVGIDRETAVGPRRRRLRLEARLARVDVVHTQRAARAQRRVLSHRRCRRARDHRRIVGPVDREAHLLFGTVGRGDDEAVDFAVGCTQVLHQAVGYRVEVAPVGSETQGTQIPQLACYGGLEGALVRFRIRDRNAAGRLQDTGDHRIILGHHRG